MAQDSKISWTDHTFNPWVGCTKVSPACDHCYAEMWAVRSGHPELWDGQRRRTKTWGEPLKWNKEAAVAGVRKKVFCASLADVFDNQVPNVWREELFRLIDQCRHLDWLLLTKRPQNAERMIFASVGEETWGEGWPHVWLGATVENAKEAERRIGVLRSTPARIHFLSCEPLMEDIGDFDFEGIDWIITGGESGPKRRPFDLQWAERLRLICEGEGRAFFFKQDAHSKPGQRGGASDALWNAKQFPKVAA